MKKVCFRSSFSVQSDKDQGTKITYTFQYCVCEPEEVTGTFHLSQIKLIKDNLLLCSVGQET